MHQIITAYTDKAIVLFILIKENWEFKKVGRGEIIMHEKSFSDTLGMHVSIPPGDWQFLSTLKDVTEEQAKQLVHLEDQWMCDFGEVYTDYVNGGIGLPTACSSLQSLAQSVGVDPEKNWAICYELKK